MTSAEYTHLFECLTDGAEKSMRVTGESIGKFGTELLILSLCLALVIRAHHRPPAVAHPKFADMEKRREATDLEKKEARQHFQSYKQYIHGAMLFGTIFFAAQYFCAVLHSKSWWDTVILLGAMAATFALCRSVCTVMDKRPTANYAESMGRAMMAFWLMVPPIWFVTEWMWLTPPSFEPFIEHCHELFRNIWLAFVVFLSFIMKIKPLSGAD